MKKWYAEVTFLAGRGASGHENLYPDTHHIPLTKDHGLQDVIREVVANGIMLSGRQFVPQVTRKWVSPSAIISITEWME